MPLLKETAKHPREVTRANVEHWDARVQSWDYLIDEGEPHEGRASLLVRPATTIPGSYGAAVRNALATNGIAPGALVADIESIVPYRNVPDTPAPHIGAQRVRRVMQTLAEDARSAGVAAIVGAAEPQLGNIARHLSFETHELGEDRLYLRRVA